jgi:hypothetical protein
MRVIVNNDFSGVAEGLFQLTNLLLTADLILLKNQAQNTVNKA